MAFNSTTAAAFFKQDVIGFGERTYQKLVAEGIQLPDDLIDFTEDGLDTIFENFRRPGKIQAPKDEAEKKKMDKGEAYQAVIRDQASDRKFLNPKVSKHGI